MQNDSSRANTSAQLGRVNFYAGIHKALRLMLSDTVTRVGAADPHDAEQVRDALWRVRGLVKICASHIVHENEFVHPALERAQPGSSARIAAEHGEHDDGLEALSELALRVETSPAADRPAALHRLYHQLALFMAENLEHMHYEETEHNAVLWAHYTDEELVALHDELIASIPPEEMMEVMHWMLPSMSHGERSMMLSEMREKAPDPAFQAVLGIARSRLPAQDWTHLSRALQLPASLARAA